MNNFRSSNLDLFNNTSINKNRKVDLQNNQEKINYPKWEESFEEAEGLWKRDKKAILYRTHISL